MSRRVYSAVLFFSFVFARPTHRDKNAQRHTIAAAKGKALTSLGSRHTESGFLVLVDPPSLSKKSFAILAAQILYGIVCQFNVVTLRDVF